jgi:lipoyl(octanoyl) transferase
MTTVQYIDLGRMPYLRCWEYQRRLFDTLSTARNTSSMEVGWILTVEHPPVYTLGKSGKPENLLVSEAYLKEHGAEYYHVDRGGDITFHGPGQIVCYPILDLTKLHIGLHDYVSCLEEAVIATVATYGICGERIAGASGVWIDATSAHPRKICALGVRASRFVTMHGLALNVSTALEWFHLINPCGFADRAATSICKEVGHEVSIEEVKQQLVNELSLKLNVKIYKN